MLDQGPVLSRYRYKLDSSKVIFLVRIEKQGNSVLFHLGANKNQISLVAFRAPMRDEVHQQCLGKYLQRKKKFQDEDFAVRKYLLFWKDLEDRGVSNTK